MKRRKEESSESSRGAKFENDTCREIGRKTHGRRKGGNAGGKQKVAILNRGSCAGKGGWGPKAWGGQI